MHVSEPQRKMHGPGPTVGTGVYKYDPTAPAIETDPVSEHAYLFVVL